MSDSITFAQLRAGLRTVGDVLAGDVTDNSLAHHVEHCAIVENAEYRPEVVDLAGALITFAERCDRRSAVQI